MNDFSGKGINQDLVDRALNDRIVNQFVKLRPAERKKRLKKLEFYDKCMLAGILKRVLNMDDNGKIHKV